METPPSSPRSELLADAIEVDGIYRDQITRLTWIVFMLLAIVMIESLAAFSLVVRNHVFILPQGTEKRAPAEPVKRTMYFRGVGPAGLVTVGVKTTGARGAVSPRAGATA